MKALFLLVAMLLLPHVQAWAATEASPSLHQSHVQVELVKEFQSFRPDAKNWIALDTHLAPHWHIYWKNFGDTGMETQFDVQLPEGFEVTEILWPAPERFTTSGLVSYGYHHRATFLLAIKNTRPLDEGKAYPFQLKMSWLECREACIPGDQSFEWSWGVENRQDEPSVHSELFKMARAKIPQPLAEGLGQARDRGNAWELEFPAQLWDVDLDKLQFFPFENGIINYEGIQTLGRQGDDWRLQVPKAPNADGETLKGVLTASSNTGSPTSFSIDLPVGGSSPKTEAPPMQSSSLWITFLMAFLGGLILNIMPCVLPVLSVKILQLLGHRDESPRHGFFNALSYTLGVMVSFWILGGLLLILREAGNELGWGFQMQSPWMICGLMALFLLMALNLFGVFEIGVSLVGVDQKKKPNGRFSAFWSGALATIAATPCTAPFMGTAVGAAFTLPPLQSMFIFTGLGLGMASPFLLVAFFPKLIQSLPKPGAWMITFKQGLGFLLMATVAYLFYVASTIVEHPDRLLNIGLAMVLLSMAGWMYGRWWRGSGTSTNMVRLATLVLVAAAIWMCGSITTHLTWQKFSPEALQGHLSKGEPVFLDFTASWCISCKANEKIVLDRLETAKLFKDHGIVPMKADWSKFDPVITQALEKLGRASVPVYALYNPSDPDSPTLLPEVLTFDDVEEAFLQLSTHSKP